MSKYIIIALLATAGCPSAYAADPLKRVNVDDIRFPKVQPGEPDVCFGRGNRRLVVVDATPDAVCFCRSMPVAGKP